MTSALGLETDPSNRDVLRLLRDRAASARSEYRLGEWELQAHPDLCDRLDQVAAGGVQVELFGLPGRATESGRLYAVAMGTGTILLRLPAGPDRQSVLDNGGRDATEFGEDWAAADAWLTAVPRELGTALLARWLEAAREAARA